ncbi:MAG: polysaccharide biosynthesis C-terminal domain-containing protein, partial [Candidatus Omnitrophica bacterium]|nr:polysaccharide biosynthesis C-terminal domain-containing protein [Candidatus Omnitrophota bacterium]
VGALFPTLSRRYQTDRKSFERAYVQSFRLMAVIGAPVCAGVTLFASQLVRLAFGEGFEASAWVLQLLAWAGLLVAFGNLNGSVLYAAGRQKVMAVVCGLGLILNIGLNIWLIPPYTYMGAAFATLVTELLVWLSLMGYLRYRLGLDTHQLWGMPDLKYLKSEEKTHGD